MKRRGILVVPVLLGLILGPVFPGSAPASAQGKQGIKNLIEKGRKLVELGGCNDCHTTKIFTAQGPTLDTSRLLSGAPSDAPLLEVPPNVLGPGKWGALASGDLTTWAGPWGVSFTANLTPDMTTGLGKWTEQMFIKTLRTGKHMGEGRQLLPPMPWEGIGKSSDEDLKAIFAYLHSLKPVQNSVRDPIPPPENH